MKNLFWLCVCLTLLGPAYASHSLPQPFEATYALHRYGIKLGAMTRSLIATGNGEYIFRSRTRTTGIVALFYKVHVVEETHWTYDGHAMRPLEYQYHQSGSNRVRDITLEYDWTNGEIRNTSEDAPWRVALGPNVYDDLLYQYVLMQDLEAGKRALSYKIAAGGRLKTYDITLLGEEIIDTPLGKLQTLKLQRQKPNSKRKTTVWCAIDLHYLAVRLERLDNDGTISTILIEKLIGLNKSPTDTSKKLNRLGTSGH